MECSAGIQVIEVKWYSEVAFVGPLVIICDLHQQQPALRSNLQPRVV